MGVTIIGEDPNAPCPAVFAPPLVYWKQNWGDAWILEPDLQLVSFGVRASSTQPASAEFNTRYGNVKFPYESDLSVRGPASLVGRWVKISLISPQGAEQMQFVGMAEAQNTQLTGGFDSLGNPLPGGKQGWVAYGGLKILQKIVVSEAFFMAIGGGGSQTVPHKVGWLPPMNIRDARGLLVGNMSQTALAGANGVYSYLYGGSGGGQTARVWSHLDYLQYLLAQFVQQGANGKPTGPYWTAGGQIDALAALKTSIRFPESATVAELLKLLIPQKYGLDFFVRPVEASGSGPTAVAAGFEVVVFALNPSDSSAGASYGGVTMPGNPQHVEILRDSQPDLMENQIVLSTERRVDTIRVCGKRIVVCGTLAAQRGIAGAALLVPRWSSAVEADYIAGAGAENGDYDGARKPDKYRDVFAHFGAPDDWDLEGGAWALQSDGAGGITDGADYQTAVRATLPWIPLKEGFDYSTDPPTDNTGGAAPGSGGTSDVKPMLAWLLNDFDPPSGIPTVTAANQLGIHVLTPYLDWGVMIEGGYNYLVAKNHLPDDFNGIRDARYDYDTLTVTIAIESDQRLILESDVASDLAAGDGSVMTILDEEAEAWVLLAGTMVDVDAAGNPKMSGPGNRILRNDSDRLALVLAGTLARYTNDRVLAALTFKSFWPWSDLVGQILTLVQEGDDVQAIGTPITSIEWIVSPSPTMILKTGYA